MRATGIDISRWKPVKDWDAVYNSGVTFVGMKATEGRTWVDPTLKKNREEFRKRPFLLGIYYHFARSGNPQIQADRFMDAVGPLRDNERLCLDLEVSVTDRPEDTIHWLNTFYETLTGSVCSDRRPIIYTSKRIWKQIGNPTWDLASIIDLWAPRYNSRAEPEIPPPWAKVGWTIWQWTDGTNPLHVTPGVGKCDANYFRGGVDELAAYAKLGNLPLNKEIT